MYTCTKCGTEFESIPNMQGLHDTLSSIIIEKAGAITPGEVRFLRTWLDVSNIEFASQMGVTTNQASRWASGDKDISPVAGRLLRMLVAQKLQGGFDVSTLSRIDRTQPVDQAPYAVTRLRDGWGQPKIPSA